MWFYFLYRVGLTSLYSPAEHALLIPKTFKGRNVISNQFIEAAHRRHLYVAVWTVNSEDGMRQLIAIGVDGILTDFPDRLLKIMKTE
jgi:glycerophosphoryl diester phosphodiesterase